MRFAILLILCFPLLALGSTIVETENAHDVLQIADPIDSQEFFGRLEDAPHTFSFVVQEAADFKSAIFVHDGVQTPNDVSIILVQEQKRGVAEIGRTLVKEQQWNSGYDPVLAESFRNGGTLEAKLEPGAYLLEVSSPNNDAPYRLVLGTEGHSQGYFANLAALFKVKSLYGSPLYTAFLSPLVYVPVALIALFGVSFWYYKRIRHAKS